METVRELIREYLGAVHKAVSELRAGFGRNDLLRARHSGGIPKDGVINGVEFSFHGVGCWAVVDGVDVNFDFGPDNRADGFDAWRLWQFAREKPAAYPQFQELKQVEKALKMLACSGEIECPEADPSPHLFYLKPQWN